MNTRQVYKQEDLCHLIVTEVDKTSITLRCERELNDDELKLLDEVLTDTITIQNTFALKRAVDRVREAGYDVDIF